MRVGGFFVSSVLFLSLISNLQAQTTQNVNPDASNEAIRRVEAGQSDVTNNGVFTYNYPIEIPAFRGLEPTLRLNYNSGRKTKRGGEYQGWLGHGWGLSGVPVIERAGYQLGVPRYASDDVFLLNGEPLAKCAGEGASCKAGGNWVSEVENYLKIKFDSASNTWRVTGRDGTVTTFDSAGKIAGTAASTTEGKHVAFSYRWLATSVTDTFGNKVSYGYNCSSMPVCYPTKISYNSRAVEFLYETRPDYITAATGHSISASTKRIKTIMVKNNGVVSAGYALRYDQAPLSGASRLVSVQRFGRDLKLDAANTIAAGTALPKTTFDYNDATGFSNAKNIAGLTGAPYLRRTVSWTEYNGEDHPQHRNRAYWSPAFLAADLNSDGVAEILKSRFDSKGNCSYTLYHSPARSAAFRSQNVSGVRCSGALFRTSEYRSKEIATAVAWGRFGADKTQTQLLVHSNDTSPPSVRYQVSFVKKGDGFAIDANDCLAAKTRSNAVKDARLKSLCGNKSGYTIDWQGDGRDGLTSVGDGLGNFFGDARAQKFSYDRDNVAKLHISRNGVWVTPKIGSPKCGFSRCTKNWVFLDLNGDGLDDAVNIFYGRHDGGQADGYLSVYLFTGDRLVKWVEKQRVNDLELFSSPFVSDVDGDGKAELGLGLGVYTDAKFVNFANKKWYLFRMRQSAAGKVFAAQNLRRSTSFMVAGDFNGDGQTDLLAAPATVAPRGVDPRNESGYMRALADSFRKPYTIIYGSATGGPANLLNSVVNEQGGQVKTAYRPSTAYANKFLPFVLPTVASVSTLDGRGQTATTAYTYVNGNYDPGRQRFLGFGAVRKTLPRIAGESASPIVRTTYVQSIAAIGLPSKVEYVDDDGAVRRTVSESYALVTAARPYSALNTATTTTRTEGSVTRTLKTTRTFDAWGNITAEINHGRTDKKGDEVLVATDYTVNTAKYLMSLPHLQHVYDGVDATGTLLKQSQFFYDDQDYRTAPAQGKLTSRRDFATESKYQTASFTYDIFGNRLTAANGEGEVTSWAYDDTYNLYVVKETNAVGHVMTAVPNAACGAAESQTDANGVVTTYSYDALCRQTLVANGVTGHFVRTSYTAFGDPANQRITTSTSRPNASVTADQTQYFDGLGRVWRVETAGDASSPTTYADTIYDVRNNKAQVSLPHEAEQTTYWTTTSFDWNNRPLKVTNPDATFKSYAYALPDASDGSGNVVLDRTLVTDEEGMATITDTSTGGDIIEVVQQGPAADEQGMLMSADNSTDEDVPEAAQPGPDAEEDGTSTSTDTSTDDEATDAAQPGLDADEDGVSTSTDTSTDDDVPEAAQAGSVADEDGVSTSADTSTDDEAAEAAQPGSDADEDGVSTSADTSTDEDVPEAVQPGPDAEEDGTSTSTDTSTDDEATEAAQSGPDADEDGVSTSADTSTDDEAAEAVQPGPDAEEDGTSTSTDTSTGDDTADAQQAPAAAGGTVAKRRLYGATYDGLHRMLQVIDAAGSTWSYGYDLIGNRLIADDPDLGTWVYVYDDANRVIRQTDARGKVTTIAYDGIGRPVTTLAFDDLADASAGSNGTLLSQNTYDQARGGYYNTGRLTSADNDAASQRFDYNADGLLQKKAVTVDGVVHTEETGYDQGRQPLWKSYGPDGEALDVGTGSSQWTYNRKAQLTAIPGYVSAITYAPDGQTASITYANGVKTTFAYSPTRRWLTGISTERDPGNGDPVVTIVDGAYGRDRTGRITSIDASGTVNDWTYAYDGYGRLTGATHAGDPASAYSEAFVYGVNDNLQSRTRLSGSFVYPATTAGRPHAPLSLNGVAFGYDANGNLLSDGARSFTYDRANRVSEVINASGSTVTLAYGPDGARVKKSWPLGTTLYPDAGTEWDPASEAFTRYPHMDIRVVGTAKYFLHRDHLSSVRAVTDIDGNIVESTRYAAFGESANKAMATQKNYVGERFDPETGLMYLNARYMDPAFGRFISPDDWNPTLAGQRRSLSPPASRCGRACGASLYMPAPDQSAGNTKLPLATRRPSTKDGGSVRTIGDFFGW